LAKQGQGRAGYLRVAAGNRSPVKRILLLNVAGAGQEQPSTPGAATKRPKMNQKGQNLIEYAILVAVIAAAMVAMSTYVFRSVQATQKVIQDGYAQ